MAFRTSGASASAASKRLVVAWSLVALGAGPAACDVRGRRPAPADGARPAGAGGAERPAGDGPSGGRNETGVTGVPGAGRAAAGPGERDEAPAPVGSAEAERRACEARGGKMGYGGMARMSVCLRATRDAGKRCRDGRECEGGCVAPPSVKAGAPTEGTCTDKIGELGCKNHVADGVARGMLCGD
jgi:hypothetical protein